MLRPELDKRVFELLSPHAHQLILSKSSVGPAYFTKEELLSFYQALLGESYQKKSNVIRPECPIHKAQGVSFGPYRKVTPSYKQELADYVESISGFRFEHFVSTPPSVLESTANYFESW